jgi:putative zinc-binding metallo-peptidase
LAIPRPPFPESLKLPIRDLGLQIEGTRLEPITREFLSELEAIGFPIRPRLYLSTEWGVPFGTVAIGIPFYLARPDLTELHAERVGHVEGFNRADILRYLRHEMGHVVNYAYKLYDQEEWVRLFGAITQPYLEDYRPAPFSRRYVRHLPGWYAQKHPDEDWAETFAVWMTPGKDWRAEYAQWPSALAKLEYCDRTVAALRLRPPVTLADELDEAVGDLPYTLDQFYQDQTGRPDPMPSGLAGALRAIFEDLDGSDAPAIVKRHPASALLKRMEPELLANVFRWTGHFPEHTRVLVRHLGQLADQLGQVYPEDQEKQAMIAVTTLVTALAMNHVHTGTYLA